jgi:Ca-activated chloride channel family protein
MKNIKYSLAAWSLWLLCALTPISSLAAGLLSPADGSLPALEIRSHEVSVIIEDGYAITTVDQVFHNPHNRDLEATYSFPVPEHGAVAEFTLWIDGKPITGEVLEKQQARKIYEEEKAAGGDAGLTEKDGYKTFDISVSPVRAGQDTRTRLVYLQSAHIDTGVGRYVYPLEEGGVDEEKLAFWTSNDKVKNKFSFDLIVKSSYPVDAVRVPGQPNANISQQTNGEWKVHIGSQTGTSSTINSPSTDDTVTTPTLATNQGILKPVSTQQQNPEGNSAMVTFNPTATQTAYTLDKDLVVYWRHQPGLPGSVDLVTYKPETSQRGTFMMVITPGDDLKPIQRGSDWVFILDISGSMRGKYATLADGVNRALDKMHHNDRFRIVLFNSSARELTNGYVNATAENIREYSKKVSSITPDQGTNLYQGLLKGIDSLDADRTSAIVLVTDGVANVGETQQRKFLELVKQSDVRLFTFIMGNSANRPMLEVLTRASNGFALSISNSDDIVGQILNAGSKVTHQALHDVEIKLDGIKTSNISPNDFGSLYRGQQLVVFGHYWGSGKTNLQLSGKVSGQPTSYQTSFNFPDVSKENPEIERLWAYANIEDMMDEINSFGEKADIKQAVTDLGVEYSLVTDYTSMLVVKDEVFEKHGIKRANKARTQVEHTAQQQRATRTAVNRRVDNHQPMYSSNRPSFGSGAISPAYFGLLAILLLATLRNRRQANAA